MIAYTSVYGNTKRAAELLCEELKKLGCSKVALVDLARSDMYEAVEDAFRYGKIVLATTTYNGETEAQLAAHGVNVVIHANHLLRASYLAMRDVCQCILEHERSKEADDLCLPIKDVLTLIPED
jgi:2-methylisocitrate lyase-like PEP mutase family enzyme